MWRKNLCCALVHSEHILNDDSCNICDVFWRCFRDVARAYVIVLSPVVRIFHCKQNVTDSERRRNRIGSSLWYCVFCECNKCYSSTKFALVLWEEIFDAPAWTSFSDSSSIFKGQEIFGAEIFDAAKWLPQPKKNGTQTQGPWVETVWESKPRLLTSCRAQAAGCVEATFKTFSSWGVDVCWKSGEKVWQEGQRSPMTPR